MSRIVIFANGELANARGARALLQPSDRIVGADGGTRQALTLGVRPDVIIGDLDSMSDTERAEVLAAGIPVQRHPHDKNETDLELALRYAREQAPDSILIVAALGRRLDHTLGNLALLTAPELAGIDIRLDDGLDEVFFCRAEGRLQGRPGDLVSLIPWGGPVEGASTEGLRWPLRAEQLHPDRTRGISNEMLGSEALVKISSGLLLVIHRRQGALA